ncbi:diaminopropionate ammonia-lyase [Roseospira navarrensis]|uniref:diaminopropionate ammonia-lyase n=1 Tax=Roseospira navarrensis TaxID=140058 RepID=UPI0031B5F0AC
MTAVPSRLLTAHPVAHVANPRAEGGRPIGPRERAVLSPEGFAAARDEIRVWPGYAETPLRRLDGLAAAAGLGALVVKDEAPRFGLGSFKALGGAYAVLRVLRRLLADRGVTEPVTVADLIAGRWREDVAELTVCCATDGNHGRSVAWGAGRYGCRCVIYVHATVSRARCEAIARFGAEVRRVPGTYDDSVRKAADDAAANGWVVVSDTSYPGYMEIPRDVMQGYTVMVDEAIRQMDAPPTHVFVQGGVGGLAAAVAAQTWEVWGAERPRIITVEPDRAACLFESVRVGYPKAVHGDLDTLMAGLACGEVSLLAWEVLEAGLHDALTVPDAAAVEVMQLLAAGRHDPAFVAGESATAGLAGCLLAMADPALKAALGLDATSRVLAFSTEGATDPALYAELVGRPAETVEAMP